MTNDNTNALSRYNSTSYTSYLTLNQKASRRHDRDRFRASLVLNRKCSACKAPLNIANETKLCPDCTPKE